MSEDKKSICPPGCEQCAAGALTYQFKKLPDSVDSVAFQAIVKHEAMLRDLAQRSFTMLNSNVILPVDQDAIDELHKSMSTWTFVDDEDTEPCAVPAAVTVCECGSATAGLPTHSTWCPVA